MGMDVFMNIPPDARLLVAEAVWQYSHHVLPGLRSHRGPILTLANWSGQWPGLVGMLNLNGSLRKAGVPYSTLWSKDFTDPFFQQGIRQWLRQGSITHDATHVRDLDVSALPAEEAELGRALARQLKSQKAILGVFDEGCMGMYNAIIDDELLNPLGIFKERLSQSALVAAMRGVTDEEAQMVRTWLDQRGTRFVTGPNPDTDLTDAQILEQCKMYVAAVRMAHEFGCDAIGIQYQQGLKDMAPASDLAEGLLNNPDRPPVFDHAGNELFAGRALPHFNEVDECAGVDALVTNRVWSAMGLDPSTTLHDVRWGEHYTGDGIDDFVWVYQISGAAPASHFQGGYAGAISERQPPMYFRLGGGTLKGVCKPGEIVWSRVFIEQRQVARGHWACLRGATSRGGDDASLARNHPAVAHHACRFARHQSRSVHGPARCQSPQCRVRSLCRGGQPSLVGESCDVYGTGCNRTRLRKLAKVIAREVMIRRVPQRPHAGGPFAGSRYY